MIRRTGRRSLPAAFLGPLWVLALLAAPAAAQDTGLEIQRGTADTMTVAPGARASIPFRISNHGRGLVTTRVAVEVPSGWRVVQPGADLALPADSSVLRVVAFFPPDEAPAGIYPITMGIALVSGGSVAATSFVLIPADAGLEVAVYEAPRWASAADRFTVIFRVENTGNVTLPVRLRLDGPDFFAMEADTTTGTLEPGSAREVRVQVTSRSDVSEAATHALRLRAAGPADSAEASARIEILPQGRGPGADRGGLPAELRLRFGEASRTGAPVRLHVAGPVRAGSTTSVDLLLQGPAREYSVFGEADTYRFRLVAPHLSLYLGDQVYALSPLTESGREGLGAEARVRAGPLEVGGFVQSDRRSLRPDMQMAAFAGLRFGSVAGLRGNALRSRGRDQRELWSVEGTLQPWSGLSVRGEYGQRPETGATARTFELRADGGPLSLSIRHLRGDEAYGGNPAGASSDGGHLRVRPWRDLYLELSFQDQSLVRGSPLRPIARSLRVGRAALGYGSHVAIEGRHLTSSWADQAPREAEAVQLRFGLPLGALRLYPSGEVGRARGGSEVEASPFWRVGLRSELGVGPALLSNSLEYFTGGSLYRPIEEEGATASVSASLRLGASTRFQLSAYGSRYVAPIERHAVSLNAMLEQRLPFGHTVTARVIGRSAEGMFGRRETLFILDYAIPFKLPIGRSSAGGSVVGRVYDVASGAPLARRIIQIDGRRVATDSNGQVEITGLRPGVHYVELDRSTTGVDQVPNLELPLRLEIGPDGPDQFEIGLVPAGGLLVRTRIARGGAFDRLESTEPDPPEPLASVLIELTRGEERIVRPTDPMGRLEIRDLRPGRWKVAVAHAELPAFHSFQTDTLVVDVPARGRAEVDLLAAPIERRVQMVATGVLSDAGAGASRVSQGGGTAQTAPVTTAAAPPPQPSAEDRGDLPEGWTTFRTSRIANLMEVARRVYYQTSLWPRIWMANRSLVENPRVVPDGTLLRIPPDGPMTDAERRTEREYYRGNG